MSPTTIADALERISGRISLAARRAGRAPAEVAVVAVTKGVETGRILEASSAGVRAIGESRVQEAIAKRAVVPDLPVEWHLIGHLQRNKAKIAVEVFDLIHSVDTVDLLTELSFRAQGVGKRQRVLLQVNVTQDPRKFGLNPAEVPAALETAKGLPAVEVEGFMTIAPPSFKSDSPRRAFRGLRELRDRCSPGLKQLSMGMTGDFEVAVEEGATFVRIGTGIFGSR